MSARTPSAVGRGGSRVELVVCQALAALGAVVAVFPLYWMVITGLKPEDEVFAWPPTFWPGQLDVGVWWRGWTLHPFTLFFANSLVIALGTTLLALLLNSMAAFAFAKYRFRGRDALLLVYLSTMMIPGQVTMIPLFVMVKELGWINTHWGVIAPSVASGFAVFFLRQYLLSIPSELIDAARIDGCGDLGIYWRIILPLAQPALIVLGILTFMSSWNQFLWPLIVLNDREKFTIPIGLSYFTNQFFTTFNYQMAVVTISLIPLALLYILCQRYIVQGIATTGLKG